MKMSLPLVAILVIAVIAPDGVHGAVNYQQFAASNSLQYRHGDCPGNDIRFLVTSLTNCNTQCKATSGCVCFLWNEANHCYLKRKTCPNINKANPKNHFFDKVAKPAPKPPQFNYQQFAASNSLQYRHGDCPGNDIRFLVTSLANCNTQCKALSSCVCFLWNEANHCYLKRKTCPNINKANPKNHFFDKVAKPAPKPPQFNYQQFAASNSLQYRHGDCPGNDIRFLTTSLANCALQCKALSSCVCFLWNEANHCYLKRKTCPNINKANPKNHFFDKVAKPAPKPPQAPTPKPSPKPPKDDISRCASWLLLGPTIEPKPKGLGGLALAATGGTSLTKGPDGLNAWVFTGSNYVKISSGGKLNLEKESFTIATYVNQDAIKNGPMVEWRGRGPYGTHLWIWGSKLFTNLDAYTGKSTWLDVAPPAAKKWSFVGVSYNHKTGNLMLWVDGKDLTKHVGALGNRDMAGDLYIGLRPAKQTYKFTGKLAGTTLMKCAINKDQIQELKKLIISKATPEPRAMPSLKDETRCASWLLLGPAIEPKPKGLGGLALATSGATSLAEGPNGLNAWVFNGKNYVKITSGGRLNLMKGSFTIASFVYQDAIRNGPMVEWRGTGTAGTHVWIWKSKLYINLDAVNQYHSAIPAKKWSFVGVSFNHLTGNLMMWVDGNVLNKATGTSAVRDMVGDLYIGLRPSTKKYHFTGKLAGTTLVKCAITKDGIQELKNLIITKAKPAPTPPLQDATRCNRWLLLGPAIEPKPKGLNGLALATSGATSLTEGPDGLNAWVFTGKNYVKITSGGKLNLAKESFTIATFVYQDAIKNGPIVEWRGLSYAGTHVWVWGSKLYTNLDAVNQYHTAIPAKKWSFVGVSFNHLTGNLMMWVDGNVLINGKGTSAVRDMVGDLYIGLRPSNKKYHFTGKLAGTTLMDCAINRDEIQELKKLITRAAQPACSHGLRFDDKTKKCVDPCPDYQQRWDGTKCVVRCIASQKWDGKKCVARCASPQKYNTVFGTCEAKTCRCYASGDPHYFQYDGRRIDFMGKCKYTFTKLKDDYKNDTCYFNVEEKNVHFGNTRVSYVKLVDVTIEGMTFRYSDQTKKVYIGGIDRTKSKFPIIVKTKKGTEVKISYANRQFKVEATACGMTTFYRSHFIETFISSTIGNKVEGICGTCNGNRNDDFIAKGQTKATNAGTFSDSWSVPDDSGLQPQSNCKAADVNGDCIVAWARKVKDNAHCGYITDKNGPFKACIASGLVNVREFQESCEFDVCFYSKEKTAAKDVPEVVCKNLAAFADACAKQGLGGVWRRANFCPLNCEANAVYTPKMYPGCEETCQQRAAPEDCASGEPEEGCMCKIGYYRLGNDCVLPAKCGCDASDGQHIDSGKSVVMKGCTTKYECTAQGSLKKLAFPACHKDASCSAVNGTYACKCNDGFRGDGHHCESKDVSRCASWILLGPAIEPKPKGLGGLALATSGATSLTEGPDGLNAWVFTGKNYVKITSGGKLNLAKESFTIATFVYQDAIKNGPIVEWRGLSYAGTHVWIWGSKLFTNLDAVQQYHTAIPAKKWSFVGVSFNHLTGNLMMWVDGNVLIKGKGTSAVRDMVGDLYIGLRPSNKKYHFTGKLAGTTLVKCAITKDGIQELKNLIITKAKPAPTPPLQDATRCNRWLLLGPTIEPKPKGLNGLALATSGATSLTEGPDGLNAWVFTGKNYVKITSGGKLNLAKESFTIATFVYQDAIKNGPIVEWRGLSYAGTHVWVWGSKLYTNLDAVNQYHTAIPAKKWSFVGVSFNHLTGNLMMWVDGNVLINGKGTSAVRDMVGDLYIGLRPSNKKYRFTGKLAGTTLMDCAIKKGEIQELKKLITRKAKPTPTTPKPPQACTYTYENADCSGYDIKPAMELNVDQCLDACTKRSDCKSIQSRKINNKVNCSLKNHVCSAAQLTKVKVAGYAQYTKKSCDVALKAPGYSHRFGDCAKHNIQHMKTNLEACRKECDYRTNCKSFVFVDKGDDSFCWLKKSHCPVLTSTDNPTYHFFNKRPEDDVISCDPSTKLDPKTQTCVPKCPDVQTKWNGKMCVLRCVHPDTQWSTTKADCILRCPDVKTKWDQAKKSCVDRCASHMQWDASAKKCKDRCSAENKWDDTKKNCVARCPAEKKWMTNKCVDRCTNAAEQWSVAETKCVPRCPDVNTKWDKPQGKCIDRCAKHMEWDNKAQKCTDRCAAIDKWNEATKKCEARCPADHQEWKGNKCVDRCTDQATKWSSEKKECVPRCPEVQTVWNQKQAKCVNRCESAERWDDTTKKCVSRCDSAADKWDEAKKQCVPRCPVHQEWKTDKCVNRCKTGEKWHEPTKKCYQDPMYPKTTEGNAGGAGCVIPFKYGGEWQEDCVQGSTKKKWCSTDEVYNGKWGYCPVTCRTNAGLNKNPGEAWVEGTEKRFCKADGEYGKIPNEQTTKDGKKCIFPFKYEKKYYGECTGSNPWCATTADLDANPDDWGRCPQPTTQLPPTTPTTEQPTTTSTTTTKPITTSITKQPSTLYTSKQPSKLPTSTSKSPQTSSRPHPRCLHGSECQTVGQSLVTYFEELVVSLNAWVTELYKCTATCMTHDHKQVNAGATWINEGIEYACGLDKKARKNIKSSTGNCLFPFTYENVKYETCTEAGSPGKPWCYIDEAKKAYGYC